MPLTVTNGTVEYSRNVKVADYENKSFKVAFSFTMEDGDTRAAEAVADDAIDLVHRKLGIAVAARPVQAPVQETSSVPPTKRGGRKQAAPVEKTPSTVDATPSAAAIVDEEPAQEAQPEAPAVTEISDKVLTDAVTKASARVRKPALIREAILAFAPRMSEIPQDKRAAFLDALDALQAG